MVSLSKMVPDEWYMSIVCVCGERLVLFQDLTRGKGSLAGAFEITCPSCTVRGCYPAEHYRYQPEDRYTEKALSRAS